MRVGYRTPEVDAVVGMQVQCCAPNWFGRGSLIEIYNGQYNEYCNDTCGQMRRKKFSSQTSDSMDRSKAEMGRVRKERQNRKSENRREELDTGWPESEEEQDRKFQVGRRSHEDNRVKQTRHRYIQTDVPRHRERRCDTAYDL